MCAYIYIYMYMYDDIMGHVVEYGIYFAIDWGDVIRARFVYAGGRRRRSAARGWRPRPCAGAWPWPCRSSSVTSALDCHVRVSGRFLSLQHILESSKFSGLYWHRWPDLILFRWAFHWFGQPTRISPIFHFSFLRRLDRPDWSHRRHFKERGVWFTFQPSKSYIQIRRSPWRSSHDDR